MWNVFNKISVARKVIREHRKYDDLSEVAKWFDIHQKLDGETTEAAEPNKSE
jgi:programmed cell death 8 (apoptosis-inducing factor)